MDFGARRSEAEGREAAQSFAEPGAKIHNPPGALDKQPTTVTNAPIIHWSERQTSNIVSRWSFGAKQNKTLPNGK